MHRIRSIAFVIVLAVPMAVSSIKADTVFHTWAEAPAEVIAGDTFTISIWTSIEGSILDQTNVAFAGYIIDVIATGMSATLSVAFNSSLPLFIEGTPAPNSLVFVSGGQVSFAQVLNWDNPIRLFDLSVTTSLGSSGSLIIAPTANAGYESMMSWYYNIPFSDNIMDTDPGSTRIITPATIRVIPAPGAFVLFSLAICTSLRRRR